MIRLFDRLKPASYKRPGSEETHFGFIAQDVQKAAKDAGYEKAALVDTPKDGMLGLNYTELIAVLTAKILQQQKQIDDLTERVRVLEEKVENSLS